jgi:pyridoxine 5-phosphate synthase
MLKLGVNIDHVATVRQARYRGREHGEPDPVEAAVVCQQAGAHGITAHLREDRRHMVDADILRLREVVRGRFNLEMANVAEMVELALRVRPDIVCLVPERREEVTTEGGLDVVSQENALRGTIGRLVGAGIEVSLFIDPELKQVEAAARVRAPFVELHTGAFAEHFGDEQRRGTELTRLVRAAELAHGAGVRVNAGHGLNRVNLPALHRVPHLEELNIGHSIVSRAVFVGLAKAVGEILALMEGYQG